MTIRFIPIRLLRVQVFLRCLLAVCLSWLTPTLKAAERELIRDPHFQSGFYLLEPKPGKRVVYGQLPGRRAGPPVWDLAQWSSRFPLATNINSSSGPVTVWSNSAKSVVLGAPGNAAADLALAVQAGAEYPQARKSGSEPWVHLLVQQDLLDPPALSTLTACDFQLEARLNRSRLLSTNDYSPACHAAQFLVYLTVANRNPKAAGYQECF